MDDIRGDATIARRAVLRHGAALAAVLAAAGLQPAGAQDATPIGGGHGGPVAIQAFGKGSLFPTQGDGSNLPPYTAILWDAADRGVVVVDSGSGSIGVVPAARAIDALAAVGTVTAALVARLPGGGARDEALWLMTLTVGGLGADPGAVTYQGAVLEASAGITSSGIAPDDLPEAAQELESGYLILFGLTALHAAGDRNPWLSW